MIAKVVFPLPIDISLDYRVPKDLEKDIVKWSRIKAPFRNSQLLGYVTGFSKTSHIKELKSIISLLDRQPILGEDFVQLAGYVAENYFCSLGEALDLMLPKLIRQGRKLESVSLNTSGQASITYPRMLRDRQVSSKKEKGEVLLLRDTVNRRWQVFEEKIKAAINEGRGIIILNPEINSCLAAKQWIEEKAKKEALLVHSSNSGKQELENWVRVKNGDINIVVGTSMAVFAPVANLGLIIIDEEDNPVYKQEQSPFYNAKDIARFRAEQSKADLILASPAPSLESYYSVEKRGFKLIEPDPKEKAGIFVQIVDLSEERYKQKRGNIILSNILERNISEAINNKKKIMLFLNRVGFSTYAKCAGCGFIIKCGRCSKNLIFAYARNELICRSCNFKSAVPEICPQCNLSYIKYLGLGTEKLESEAHRLFPSARILRYDRLKHDINLDKEQFDVLITTQIILKDLDKLKNIDLLGVVSLDSSLNRLDFRAAEKTFQVMSRLLYIVKEKAIIQTAMPEHYLIKPLMRNDYALFYKEELNQRKELRFPPFSFLLLVTLRGRLQEKVGLASEDLFNYLKDKNKDKKLEIYNPALAFPLKLRDNFRYNILLKSRSKKTLIQFANKYVKNFKKSGIIITVDMDPL
ncbi:MAG: primosomal protein N' [Candidatus Omnitrophota bacterium]|nr:primosomal protein N' [Candidatus Omnitrophota bacterium]